MNSHTTNRSFRGSETQLSLSVQPISRTKLDPTNSTSIMSGLSFCLLVIIQPLLPVYSLGYPQCSWGLISLGDITKESMGDRTEPCGILKTSGHGVEPPKKELNQPITDPPSHWSERCYRSRIPCLMVSKAYRVIEKD